MRIVSRLSKLKKLNKKKKIIGFSSIVAILAIGSIIYTINITSNKNVESTVCETAEDNDEEDVVPEEEATVEEVQPAEEPISTENTEITDNSAEVQENVETPDTLTSNNNTSQKSSNNTTKTASNTPEKQETVVNEPAKEQQVQEEPVSTTPITYTSPSLGISFDMPGSWANKYTITDDGTKVTVYMKRENTYTGDGCLLIITSNMEDYDNGMYLDSIAGVNKTQTINGKQYLVGAPTDCRVDLGDPDLDLYKTMVSQVSGVLQTLR